MKKQVNMCTCRMQCVMINFMCVIFLFKIATVNCKNYETVSIPESTVLGNVVHTFPKVDNNKLAYYLYSNGDPDGLKYLSVSEEGSVVLKSALEYVVGKDNSFFIVVILRSKLFQHGGEAHVVKFIVKDTNNKSPKFGKKMYYGFIEEGMPSGTKVGGLEDCYATDEDSSGVSDYTIVNEGKNKDIFMVDIEDRQGMKLVVVKTKKPIDRDEMRLTPHLDLQVRADDGGILGKDQKFDTTVIRILINDRNDNPPVFLHTKWQTTILENAEIGVSVLKISASDNDDGQNAEIYYYFDRLNEDFMINPSTGVIRVARHLNVDRQNIYELTVVAQDKSLSTPLKAESFVKIQVLNVPRYPPAKKNGGRNTQPSFNKRSYSVMIRQDLPVKSTVFFEPANDPDPYGPMSDLTYQLKSSNNLFQLNSKSGVITLASSLKSIQQFVFTFKLIVTDGAGEIDTTEVQVNIQKLDRNKYNPVFEPSTVNLVIPQNIEKNSDIGYKAYATDRDYGVDGEISYSIVEGTGIGRFKINSQTGQITTTVVFKDSRVYDLYIRAQDGGRYRRTGKMYIRITVKPDLNIAPVFSVAMYPGYAIEGTENTFVGAVFAKSLIPTTSIYYSTERSRSFSGLRLDPVTGVITTTRKLSYEDHQSIFLEISAMVQGGLKSSKSAVNVAVVNQNLNGPVFPQLSRTVHIAENSGNIPSLACLSAIDKDGDDITYSLKSGNSANMFSINKKTGQLSAKSLDYETTQNYQLQVVATDGKHTAEMTVNVVVQDTNDPPQFDNPKFFAGVKENSDQGTMVKTLGVTSVKSDGHLCAWGEEGVTPEVIGLFTLSTEPSGCVVKVRSSGKIKWSREKQEYTFAIKVMAKMNRNEQSTSLLNVKIRDTNDNVPVFQQSSYAISVPITSQTIGKRLLKVQAFDRDDGSNGKVSYTLERSRDSNLFTLNPSGDILVKSALSANKEYVLTITARDQGDSTSKTSVKVYISVVSTGSRMLSFGDGTSSSTISESMPINSDVMQVSGNSNNIQYSIVGGDYDDVFTIRSTGLIKLKKSLDYEQNQFYRIVVRGMENGVPTKYVEKTFVINVDDANDNAPVFAVEKPDEKLKIFLDRFSPKGTIIHRVKAYDADSGNNGIVTYTVQGNAPVNIDRDGTITVTREISEVIGEKFEFNIVATDSNPSVPKQTILGIIAEVQNGEKSPVFDAKIYTATLGDDVPVGTTVTTITTSDTNPQSTATFRVASGDLTNNFCIDSSKVLKVQQPIDLDVFGQPRFTLSVEMTNGYRTSKVDVIVTLTDENDNRPEFFNGPGPIPITVSESSKEGETIYEPSVVDKDRGLNSKLTYSIVQVTTAGRKTNPFSIDRNNGKVTLIGKNPLNFETADTYVIIIKVEDSGSPRKYGLQELRINVGDENDERPTFSENTYSEVISRTEKPGHTILQVIATDLDSGPNGKVTYEIIGGNQEQIFNIDSAQGHITLLKPVALSDQSNFKLQIRAEDKQKQQSQAVVDLTVVTKEGPPQFALSKFSFTIDENNNPETPIGTAKAVSLGVLTYYIVKGNPYGIFAIDKHRGIISSKVPLDAENATNHLLYIRAADVSERFAEASVAITVVNVNDNGPKFRNANNGLIETIVNRDITIGGNIVKVQGYDDDVGDDVRYRISTAAARSYFQIDRDGVVKSLKSLKDFEVGSNVYLFVVTATDEKGVSTRVNIRIVLVNKQPGEIIRTVSEATMVSDMSIIKIGYKYPRATFKIVYPDVNPFLIDSSTGNIRLNRKLDYEKQNEYTIFIQEINVDRVEEYVTYEVRVQVTDENDNKPQILTKEKVEKVNKNALPGTVVTTVLYNDADSGDAGTVDLEINPDTVPFSINPTTAEITTTGWSLTEDWYNITVIATDRGQPPLFSSKKFYIKTGENPPEFDQSVYHFDVSEDATLGSIIGKVGARSLSGIPVRYDIESGNEKNVFNIDSQGQLTLQIPLDFESGSSTYTLIVVAKENNQKPLEARVNVVINVINENDNAPEFTQIEYTPAQRKSENVPVGETLLTVTATDKDCGEFGKCTGGVLTYSINEFKDTFSIDAVTGAILNIAPLDYEKHQEYRFSVKVTDNGDKPLTGVADVVIPLQNANDNPPVFNPNASSLSMAEVVKTGTVVRTVQASDADGDELIYQIVSGGDGNFEINQKTGVIQITTKKKPVFKENEYLLKISAFDGLHKDYYELKILVEDVNDNGPVFTDCSTIKATVEEGQPVGSPVIKVTATDADRGRNGEIEYVMQEPQDFSGFLSSYFNIDNSTGLITTNAVLDREARSSFIVLIVALDGGHGRSTAERNTASCQLEIKVLDINDNTPKFLNSYSEGISIAENVPINKEVLRVEAEDLDEGTNSEITYTILNSGDNPNFKIDSTGAITVARSLIGKLGSYKLNIQAKDNGQIPRLDTVETTILVQSSNPPVFEKSSYTVWQPEDVKVGSEVVTVKARSQGKGDNTDIFYSLLPGFTPKSNYPVTFAINSNTGAIKTGRSLDYEALKEYDLTVIARDERGMKSSVKVYIKVNDVNDNTPLFVLSNYEFATVENKPPGQIVGRINATDPDSGTSGQIRYSLIPSDESDKFQIDSTTGELRTKVSFDREKTPKLTINVKAQDMGNDPLDSSVYVIITVIDVNDNKPEFVSKRYDETVAEDTPVGSDVLEVRAKDADIGENARLNYHIVSGNDKGYFGTKSKHFADGQSVGYIVVEKPLNREDKEMFELKIAASDPGFDDTFTDVIITVTDVNDNDPEFEKPLYNATVPENSKSGIYVTTVSATDVDTPGVQKPITYKLAKETDGQFVIDKNTGVIKTGSNSFDREQKSVHTFLVLASDGTRTGTSRVRVEISDQNDEEPIFDEGPYVRYVRENEEPSHHVGYVVAKDRDEGSNAMITYSLKTGMDKFSIEPNTGLIRTKVKLDRESNDNEFKVIVVGTDQGINPKKGEVDVTIMVTDANDQEPIFSRSIFNAQVEECGAIGQEVTQVTAEDGDLGENAELLFSIASGNTPRRFRIDPETGVITIAHHLDYETKKNYKLSISVRDRGLPQKIGENAIVNIAVGDCNDNSPRFNESTYKVTVPEDQPIGAEIITVTASDKDIGTNGDFYFLISDPDENYQFTISSSPDDPKIGIVRLAWKLDRETIKEHVFNIGAKDKGKPALTGFAQLTVEVEDVNDNPPVFVPSHNCGHVEEEMTGVQTVATVQVTDSDTVGHQCPCTYQLIDPSDKFTIEYKQEDSTKAVIKTKPDAKFDREGKGQQLYKLVVKAANKEMPNLTAETIVYVEVGDKDDNKPSSGGKMSILVNSFQGQFRKQPIGRVLIIDNDRGLNHTYKNKIQSSTPYFEIDSHGKISVTDQVIPVGKYDFNVISEQQQTKVKSSVDVTVREISEESIRSSIPIRISGLRKLFTCNEIKFIDFEPILADALGVDVSMVTVFSIMGVRAVEGAVDVWFSVKWWKGADGTARYMDYMDLLVKLNEKRTFIEKRTGGRMLSVGIDACASETCNKGFCYNEIQGSSKYSLVTDENGMIPAQRNARTFVSIEVQVVSRCKSGPPITDTCDSLVANPCLNGGICSPLRPSGFKCNCQSGFDGPQCQVTTRHVSGNGYFWLKPISYFYEGFISFEFSTTSPDGLILYHGPISKLSSQDVLDFLAVDMVGGKLRISISQGERKMFQRVLESNKVLTDGAFHHVRIEKRGKSIELVLDYCDGRELVEGSGKPTGANCQLNGTIPGRWKFINGIYPLQIGGLRNYKLDYPDRKYLRMRPFSGCVRNIIDNGVMYDLKYPLLKHNTGTGCPASSSYCLSCLHGYCDMTMRMVDSKFFPCRCQHGWTGKLCNRRVEAFSYRSESFSKYSMVRKPVTWYDHYTTHYMVQVRTRSDGVILHEEGSPTSVNGMQYNVHYSILEIKNSKLQYRFNLGDGQLILYLPDNVTDGSWHNITVYRRGNHATLEMMTSGKLVNRVSDSKGSFHMLNTNGVLYVGGTLDREGNRTVVVDNFEGCIADNRYQHHYLDLKEKGMDNTRNSFVDISRQHVYKNCTCDAAGAALCLNGGVCIAGSPPYCQCYFGWSGLFCGVKAGSPLLGSPPALGTNGMMILVVLVLAFLLVLMILALFMANFQKKHKAIPIYVDENGRENIMPYNDEGAGEDDFQNYDLEKLLQHQGGKDLVFMDEFASSAAGVSGASAATAAAAMSGAGGGAGGASSSAAAGATSSSNTTSTTQHTSSSTSTSRFASTSNKHSNAEEKEPLIQAEHAFQAESANMETTFTSNFQDFTDSAARARFNASKADDIDVAAFIQANLTDADNDDAYLPRDTLLHYGYEGEGSDVEDLSEISDIEDDDDEEEDFTFLRNFGRNFHEVNIIFNPEDEYDDEV